MQDKTKGKSAANLREMNSFLPTETTRKHQLRQQNSMAIKHEPSLLPSPSMLQGNDVDEKLKQKTLYLISMWSKNTNSFNNLLNSSKGRDKFCQLLQYAANLYVTCMRDSDVYGKLARDKKVSSVNRMKNLESQISNGRKIFRLLLFLNEIKEFDDVIKDSKL
jgi:hypothetical protein